MSITKNLLFFNKEGYPYNFTYTDDMWSGKILFNPNGSDTFENLSMYILEKVDPIIIEDTISIINDELYNVSGMTITPYTTSDITVTNIKTVNKSPNYYTKWIYGKSIHKKFPPSTIISFSGTIDVSDVIDPVGNLDFTSTKLYTVITSKKDAIMITSDTPNDLFNISGADWNNSTLKVNSNRTISFPEYKRDLYSEFFPGYDMKLSVVGTTKNDGVYEIETTGKTYISIYDYNLSGLTTSDKIELDVELLIDRPLLYTGSIDIYKNNDLLLANFINNKTSSLNIGTTFIIENNEGEHLYDGNEYTIQSFLEQIKAGSDKIEIVNYNDTDDDGKNYIITNLDYDSTNVSLNEQDTIYLKKLIINENIKTVISITSGDTMCQATLDTSDFIGLISGFSVLSGYTTPNDLKYQSEIEKYYVGTFVKNTNYTISTTYHTYIKYNPSLFTLKVGDKIYFTNNVNNNDLKVDVLYINNVLDTKYRATLDTYLKDDIYYYDIIKVFKEHEKSIAVVSSSINDNIGLTNNVRCLSTTNVVKYTHEYINSVSETIDTFIKKYKESLSLQGIDLYKINDTIILENIYSGQKYYFKSILKINDIIIDSEKLYSDDNNISSVYNFILKNDNFLYERTNMSETNTKPFYADIKLSLSDDVQDYGFNINIDDIDYYIPYNDNSGTTSCTYTTIESFISKWESVFNKNGLYLWSDIIVSGNTEYHLYIQGYEPNVTISKISVRVNNFSSYNLDVTYNSYTMVTSNCLYSETRNFISDEFTTGMIISLTGSQYPSNNKEYNIIGLHNNIIELSYQGSMYSDSTYLTIISREYLRRPRESNLKDIYYNFRWDDDLSSEIFMYDLSGENLTPWMNHIDYTYTGPKPLPLYNDVIFLNKEPNKDKDSVNIPHKQQTIFDELKFKLERFDDDNATILPKPITVSFGYNSTEEGVNFRKLIIERIDNVIYSGYSDGQTLFFTISENKITINTTGNVSLLDYGFEVDRIVRFKLDDKNEYTQTIFEDWQDFIITDVTNKTLTINGTLTTFSTEGLEFYFTFEQLPEMIGTINLYGETETEDERLKSHMKLLGINLTEEDEYIFAESNIKEQGVDYKLLNIKRKEMMSVYPDIYNYIGSYTAIFNTINFFGYTDLELYEYYRNIDPQSPLFNSFKRVVVQDLFDKEIEGWSYSEELSKKVGYKKTNLMNLTYKITDEEGNNINLYSLSDVQVKLNGLKNWLRNWIIPINSNIRDLTGVSQNTNIMWRQFDSANDIIKHKTSVDTETIGFNYIATKNFNDSWLISIRFYNVNDFVPEYFDLKVVTYVKDTDNKLIPQTYYSIYKTDMLPFNFYLNWTDGISDKYLHVETTYYNEFGIGRTINKMFGLEDGVNYVYDEFKNYILINNNFKYKYPLYTQDLQNIYIIDDDGNIYIVDKSNY